MRAAGVSANHVEAAIPIKVGDAARGNGAVVTVMGATGNSGKKITEALLKAGEKVRALGRALGRSESKLADLKSAGAEALAGDTTDAAFLAKAYRGADAVYMLMPTDRREPDYTHDRLLLEALYS